MGSAGRSTVRPVRWESLFADLEAQMEHMEASELTSEVADRTRREVARFRLIDRIRPAFGHPLTVTTLGGGQIAGRVAGIGADWVLLAEDRLHECLVPLDAVTGIVGLGGLSAVPGSEGRVAAKLTLAYALRGVARDRAYVVITMRDASIVTGTIDRVGTDFFEMAEHGPYDMRRNREIWGIRTVPFTGISFIRRSS